MAYMKIKNEIFGTLEARWDRIIRGLPPTDEPDEPPQGGVGGLREIINNIADGLQNAPDEGQENDRVELWFDDEGENGAGLVIDVVEETEDEDEDGPELIEANIPAPRHDGQQGEDRALGGQEQDAAQEPQELQPEPAVQDQPQNLAEQQAPAAVFPQAQPQRRAQHIERAVRYSIRDLTSTILGALLLPSVSWAAGELLRLALPRSWTTPPGPSSRPFFFAPSLKLGPQGLMQEQWGRSLVGGCAWVVLKDAFRLYVKYRRAAIRPLRRVPNVKPRSQRT